MYGAHEKQGWAQQQQAVLLQAQKEVSPAIMCIAFGGAGFLVGTLIAFLSEGGRTPGTVIAAVGFLLFSLGIVWFRQVKKRHQYRITHPFSATLFLSMAVAIAVVIAASFLVAIVAKAAFDMRIPAVMCITIAIPPVMMMYMTFRSAMKMDRYGINLGRGPLPWPAVTQIVISGHPDGKNLEIGARLHPEAQLPENVVLPEPDPNDPAGPRVHTTVSARQVKIPAFVAAIARLAPPGVQVIERTAAGERNLTHYGQPPPGPGAQHLP